MIAALFAWLPMFLLTVGLECAVIAVLTRRGARALPLQVCVALNLLTHPLATLLVWRLPVDVTLLELPVVAVEWLGYAHLLRCSLPRALLLAGAANTVSWFGGLVLWALRVS